MSQSQEPEHEHPRVPPELARSIVELVTDKPTLASLSRVSRTLNHEAERVLYYAPFPCDREQTILLLDVMASNRRVARHVHTLVVDITEDREVGSPGLELATHVRSPPLLSTENSRFSFENCMHSLSIALSNMPKLRSLKIFPDATYDSVTSAWPLRNCAGRLQALRCGFTWDEELIGFLSEQPEITDLCLEHSLGRIVQMIPSTLVPKLSIFEGMPSTAGKICVGRPVTHLSLWLDDSSNLSSLIPQLARSTRPIVSLELGDYNVVSVSDMVLVGAHVHFPWLRFLGPCIVTPWEENMWLADIGLFKNLHTILLLDFERQPRSPNVPGRPAQRTFIADLHDACPSIRRVAFSYSVGEPWSCVWKLESGTWYYRENAPVRFLWRDV